MATNRSAPQRPAPSAIGQLVKQLRTGQTLTQEELAERAGVSARLISDLERGVIQRPRRDTVAMLADGLQLSDSERAEFEALARSTPADELPATPSTRPPTHLRLPFQPSPLIGREREIAAVTSLILQPDVRLLALTGTGGVGKTRLAIETARRVESAFSDGVTFVDLAPVSDPAFVLQAVARTLGVQYESDDDFVDYLIAALQQARQLVVLDNVEHVIATAPVLANFISHCPGLKLLITSRQPLRLRAEREYPVAPLTLPDLDHIPALDELGRIPAVELFVARTEAIRPAFALTETNAKLIAELAVRLEGLPLAIELAAARLRVLTPHELLERLERRLPLLTGGALDLPERQQTLRAAIDWSHELLSPGERALFRRLAVFAGGFTLDAAQAVAGDEDAGSTSATVDTVTSLVEKNLLRTLTPDMDQEAVSRFAMLETIREYAFEHLESAGELAAVRGRHARWMAKLAERAMPELTGPQQRSWFARLRAEDNNLRAALAWSIDSGDAETAQRMCGRLFRYWITEGLLAEGRRWMDRALAMEPACTTRERAQTLLGATVICYFQGDYALAEAHGAAALETFDCLGDATGVASSHGNLGLIADAREDYPLAIERYQRALDLFRALDDEMHVNFMLGNLGLIAYLQGDYDRAVPLLEESLALARKRGDDNSVAISLGNLGLVALACGQLDDAESLQREALQVRRTVRNLSHLARTIENLALIAAARSQAERVATLFGAAAEIRAETGARLLPGDQEQQDRAQRAARARVGDSAFEAAWTRGAALEVEAAIELALRAGIDVSQYRSDRRLY